MSTPAGEETRKAVVTQHHIMPRVPVNSVARMSFLSQSYFETAATSKRGIDEIDLEFYSLMMNTKDYSGVTDATNQPTTSRINFAENLPRLQGLIKNIQSDLETIKDVATRWLSTLQQCELSSDSPRKVKRLQGMRGRDRKKRQSRHCALCRKFGSNDTVTSCPGRGCRKLCEYYKNPPHP